MIASLPEPPVLIRGIREILPLATTTTDGTGLDTAVRVRITKTVALSTDIQTFTDADGHPRISDSDQKDREYYGRPDRNWYERPTSPNVLRFYDRNYARPR